MDNKISTHPCSLCGEVSEIPYTTNSFEEVNVVDYRIFGEFQKISNNDYVVVEGWKLKHIRSIKTFICDRCYRGDFERRRRKEMKVFFPFLSLFVCSLAFIIYVLSNGLYSKLSDGLTFLFYASPIVLGIALLFTFPNFSDYKVVHTSGFSYQSLQTKSLEKLLGFSPTVFEFPNTETKKDASFFMVTEKFVDNWPMFENLKLLSGWSWSTYSRKNTGTRTDYSPEKGAEFLKSLDLKGPR